MKRNLTTVSYYVPDIYQQALRRRRRLNHGNTANLDRLESQSTTSDITNTSIDGLFAVSGVNEEFDCLESIDSEAYSLMISSNRKMWSRKRI